MKPIEINGKKYRFEPYNGRGPGECALYKKYACGVIADCPGKSYCNNGILVEVTEPDNPRAMTSKDPRTGWGELKVGDEVVVRGTIAIIYKHLNMLSVHIKDVHKA